MPQYILQTKELCKEFAHTAAVNRVSMNIQQGDIYGFIGENGAGKTTFMRMVAGLASPTSGKIKLFGQENLQAGRHYIGCTIENPALYKNMTARENLEIFRLAFGVKNAKSTDKVLSLMGLADTGKKRVGDFSLGMKQRLAIAVALLGDPQFLILDEPINGLDPVGIQELRNLFVQLNREQNITLLISSHILGELSKIATRYGIIHKGSLVSELSANDLMDQCQRHLIIRTDCADKAVNVLQAQLGIAKYKILTPYTISLKEYVDQSEVVNKVLMQNGLVLFESTIHEDSLEDYFNSIIAGGKQNA